ncbi:MarR family winged helix-turn-helix transcriptional regulator [Neptunicoccus cionae]|uniref:MarR family winged helix-turn-helix transcriptional regulator n=1 Tax=Neptunicoccus cionae TaxID=2035344 RepID=UPI000C773AD2|nr:MarR family winged helix-turn-helix transcriptional regulator [Amylibacter cionae]PLS23449.1 MarR family transcriptional regulator [Amylibacter cionae]
MSAASGASEQKIGTSESAQDLDDLPDMLEAKLWENPCPFTFRINYLALLYNTPLYSWIQDTYGLKRHEYVVIYSLALANGGSARDISRTSGFPKNTLSRAVKRLELMGLLEERSKAPGGGRRQALRLSEKGWKLFNETVPVFESYEERMLTPLSKGERQILFELMSKVVVGAEDWADDLPQAGAKGSTRNTKGETQ